jgi:2-polyprenyl-3-methyl-5-hydroxy-6-metoxy-1,4-benzoquinol methylase
VKELPMSILSPLSLRGSFRVPEGLGDDPGMSSALAFQDTLLPLVKRNLAAGSRILDLGAGAGLFSLLLEKSGYAVVSADMFPARCKRPCVQVDMNTVFSDAFAERFDAICCFEVLEHIENPRLVLREIRTILKPNGMLFVSTPDASGLYSRIRFFLTGQFAMFSDSQYHSIGHITPISYWQIQKMFEENNLKILEQLDYDGSRSVPRTIGDAIKIVSRILQPMLRGHVGRQVMVFACRAP